MILFALLACPPSEPTAPSVPPPAHEIGVHAEKAPAVHTEMTEAQARPRMYNFWATWCGPCVAELPRIATFASKHPEIEVVLVNTEFRSQRPAVEKFVAEHELTGLRTLMIDDVDPDLALPAIMGDWPDAVPVSVFVRADGKRGKMFVGAVYEADLAAGLTSVR